VANKRPTYCTYATACVLPYLFGCDGTASTVRLLIYIATGCSHLPRCLLHKYRAARSECCVSVLYHELLQGDAPRSNPGWRRTSDAVADDVSTDTVGSIQILLHLQLARTVGILSLGLTIPTRKVQHHSIALHRQEARNKSKQFQGTETQTACSQPVRFAGLLRLKVRFAGLLWEKNTAGWLLIPLISSNEQGEKYPTETTEHFKLQIEPNTCTKCVTTRACILQNAIGFP
jgi:hypothetical protein